MVGVCDKCVVCVVSVSVCGECVGECMVGVLSCECVVSVFIWWVCGEW